MIARQAEIQQAYKTLLQLHETAQQVKDNMKGFFKYSPFEYLPGKIKRELLDIRKAVIERAAEALRQTYMPNVTLNTNFVKWMDDHHGELTLNISALENWFILEAKDKEKLTQRSLESILDKARRFLYYERDDKGYWGPLRNWLKLIEKPGLLLLKAHTKSSYGDGLSVHFNNNGECAAVEKVIEIATRLKDPATVTAPGWLTYHIQQKRHNEAENFYGKVQVRHPTVSAFQFFKNDKFKIWFERAHYADRVAQALVPSQNEQPQKELNK